MGQTRISYIKGTKRQFFDYFFAVFPYIWPLARPNIAKREPLLWKKLREGPEMGLAGFGKVWEGFGMFGMASGWVWEAANFVNAGFWRLRAPETSIWAPEGAFGPKRQFFLHF